MRGADSIAGTIKSGGKTRRAAKMVVLNVDHPDIEEFVECKAKEEKKAYALGEAGYDMSLDGDAWISIQYQNANNSVRVTDDFMQRRAGRRQVAHPLRHHRRGRARRYDARELMRQIAQAAWECADPGMQYHTTINDWHTCPNTGPINASNPCSEYMHIDDSACNLASINLLKFLGRGRRLRRRGLPARRRAEHHGAGDHRRQLQLPDAEDRARTRSTTASSASATPTWAPC